MGATAATAIVDPFQTVYVVPLDDLGAPTLGLELWGELRTDGAAVSGWLGHQDSYGSGTFDIDGTLAPRASLRFTLHDRDHPGSLLDGMPFDLVFDPAWDRDAAIASVAGSWKLGDAMLLVGEDGRIDGRAPDGTVYYGRIAPAWRDVDLYDMNVEAYFGGESQPWFFEGVAIDRGDASLLFTLHGDRYGWFGSMYWSDVLRR
jgi:hypothetical protein